MRFLIDHTVLYDLRCHPLLHLLSLLFLILVILYTHRKVHKMKNEKKDLEDMLSDRDAMLATEKTSPLSEAVPEVTDDSANMMPGSLTRA